MIIRDLNENKTSGRLPPFQHNGILLVDKPAEWTSHDVINFLRRTFNIKKAGHCGTLDPAATGLLVAVLGHATKLSGTFSGQDKVYEGRILFGLETDSEDMDGNVTSQKDASFITEKMVYESFAKFEGRIMQTPPMVSAVKKDGVRLYEIARAGRTVERDPKEIMIHEIKVDRIYLPFADFHLRCSKGTYVRTLCSDIGKLLGCGAVLHSLRRLQSGNFHVDNASAIQEMRKWTQDDLYRRLLGF